MKPTLSRVLTVLALNKALSLYETGELDRAEPVILKALARLEAVPLGRRFTTDLPKAYQLAGSIRLQRGDTDGALGWFSKAEDAFERDAPRSEAYGRFLHDVAGVFGELNINDMAVTYANRALNILRRFGDTYVYQCQRLLDDLADGDSVVDLAEAVSLVDRRQREVAVASSDWERALANQRLAAALVDSDLFGEQTSNIHHCLDIAWMSVSQARELDNTLALLNIFIEMHWKKMPLPAWAEAAARHTIDHAHRQPRMDLRSGAYLVLATVLHARGATSEALSAALTAVALADQHALVTETSVLRMFTGRIGEYARQLALIIALETGDATLAAELIESGRFQVLPSVSPQPENSYLGGSAAGYLRETGRVGVGELRPISVAGRSRLAEHYSSGSAGRPLELESAIRAVGGDRAYWWGTWSANTWMYWSVRTPDGAWSCGSCSLEEGGTLRSALLAMFETSMHNSEATSREILLGDWCRDPAVEELQSVKLGDHLVPPAIRPLFDRTVLDGAGPASVVLAGWLFTVVPTPLLALPAREPGQRPVRLVEAAVLHVAPPAVIVAKVMNRPAPPAGSRNPLRVACVDPRNDLKYSKTVPVGTITALTGAPGTGEQLASVPNVLSALNYWPLGAPGLFFFSGHAGRSGDASGGDDCLVLHDGLLSASALLTPGSDRRQCVNVPTRAILSACQSSGAAGTGAGEWLGLSAALLLGGARQIVATNWSVWDTPFTSRFDLSLAHALQGPADPALVLRDLQLDYLAEWRDSDHSLSDENVGFAAADLRTLPFPIIWSAYACIGVVR